MVSEWAAQVIGINYYPDYTTLKPLTATAEDAEKIAGQLKQYGYRPFRVQCLPGTLNQKGESKIDHQEFVRMPELQEVIVNLFNPLPPNPTPETALFFFSGHGWCRTVAGQKEVFLATSDAYPEAEIYGIRLSWLGEQLQISRAKRVVVWLDCCYSGELLNFIPKDKDYCLITATRSYETGVEIPHTQGLLTQALLAGLNPENVHSLQEAFALSLPDLSYPETTENIAHVIGERLKALNTKQNTPVILIIDQFEECFTMGDDSQRQGFFDCLRQLIDCTDNLYIFIGMRSDFRGRWREYPEFASRIQKPYINVEHLNRQEIEEAITKPADWV